MRDYEDEVYIIREIERYGNIKIQYTAHITGGSHPYFKGEITFFGESGEFNIHDTILISINKK